MIININDRLNKLKIITETQKISSDYQFYGLSISKKLSLNERDKGRIMGFLKRGNSGDQLEKVADKLISLGSLKKVDKDMWVNYLFGAYRRSL